MLKENRICVEGGEIVVFDIRVSEKCVLFMGNMNLDENTEYPQGADLLISSSVKTEPFVSLMRQEYPGVPVICPQASLKWIEME